MQIALLGLEKTGGLLLEKFLREGHQIIGWNRSKDVYEQLKVSKSEYLLQQKLQFAFSIEGIREKIVSPRVFWMMLPTADMTNDIVEEIVNIAEHGDIIVDGGNSHFKDTQRHFDELVPKGIKYMGIGISGGIYGLDGGFCLMAGGDKDGYEYIRPALDSLSTPGGGHGYFGPGGSGHFLRMIQVGIEFGMIQALTEGFGILAKSPYSFNLSDVSSVWQRGSVIRSFILDMALNTINSGVDINAADGIIEADGEGKWTVDQGRDEHLAIDVLEKALDFRKRSQFDKAVQSTLAAKLAAELRKQYVIGEEKKEG